MLKTIITYAVVILFVWFLPDLYVFSRNISGYIYQEAANNKNTRVEVKIVQKMEMLPEKFAYLSSGLSGYYVELVNVEDEAESVLVDDKGVALFTNMVRGEYTVVVAKEREFSSSELMRSKEYKESLFVPDDYAKSSLTKLEVKNDTFAVAVLLP